MIYLKIFKLIPTAQKQLTTPESESESQSELNIKNAWTRAEKMKFDYEKMLLFAALEWDHPLTTAIT